MLMFLPISWWPAARKASATRLLPILKNVKVKTAQVNADNVDELVALFNDFKPELVVNLLYLIRTSPSWMPAWLTVSAISTLPTTNRWTRQNMNIAGNGPIKTVSKSGSDGYPGMRIRSGCNGSIYSLCSETSFR